MKILFVVSDLMLESLGIMYLSSILKEAGHTVGLAFTEMSDTHRNLLHSFIKSKTSK